METDEAELAALEEEAAALEARAARRGGLPGARRALLVQGPLVALLACVLLLVGHVGRGDASAATASPAKLALLSPYLDPPKQASGPVEAYLSLRNGGGSADRLLDVSTPWATTVRLVDGSGRTQPWIGVPADATLSLHPGGLHLELSGLRRTPALHDVIQLDLTFAQSGTVHVWAPVGPANSLTVEEVMHAMDYMDRLPPQK
ncbi:copper chaperone PCu(A)C [Streptacidiphilus jiangxiensis]|uniref:Copper(I)-binding protein n=1 Tax=Streptacidiphilus jiangxiensis TaxID=235985 RepID=A0A1H7Y907_STRJI|nr:copper chaperone PCu(A)C [Streptacidiphilus jiangxiensis]SEM42652.1 Copper(I)-binding protein [Streptacidiphilus jiangxiensis]